MTTLPVAPGDRSVLWRDVFPPTWHLKPVKYVCSINQRALPNPDRFEHWHTELALLDQYRTYCLREELPSVPSVPSVPPALLAV